MADDESDHPEDKSDIPAVTLPPNGFQSRIPAYLLEGKTEAEQYILNEVSKMGHFIEVIAPIIVESNLQVRRTNGRLKRVEAWKEMLGSWKVLAAGILTFIAAMWPVVQFVIERLSK